ncbi:MAG: hypothetical protein RI907_1154 [Pseudomonadota bacterium]
MKHDHPHATALHAAHASVLDAELEWLATCLQWRLQTYFGQPPASPALPFDGACQPPTLPQSSCGATPYSTLVAEHALDAADRLVMALALAPLLRPQLLDVLATRNEVTQRPYTEFGLNGWGQPTAETACFLLAGDQLAARLAAIARLGPEGQLARLGWLTLGNAGRTPEASAEAPAESSGATHTGAPPANTSPLLDALQPSPAWVQRALPGLGLLTRPNVQLPAQVVRTRLGWDDLVLPATTLAQLDDIHLWLTHGAQLLHDWGLARRISPGYICLFYGPPGTGKTLSAGLLGRRCGREVWRVDLSQLVSKYIGETEKNLSRIFEVAEQQQWILFFDEADALFGKRTAVADAHDRYANQEVSYLLQRIEAYTGVVILASNLRHHIDDAFLRRFQSVVHFALPRPPERLRLWREAFPPQATLAPDVDLPRLAQQHEVSGGTIMNVVRHACLQALGRGDHTVRAADVDEGLRRELLKEGRSN